MSIDSNNAFDKLVAGLSSEDRKSMLNNINRDLSPSIQFTETEAKIPERNISIELRLKQEPLFYKFILWLKSIISKQKIEFIYNEDLLSNVERRLNKDHPGVINYRTKSLDSVFYSLLKGMKDASDFFKPYFSFVNENPGDFYVFLSSFVAPEIAEKINGNADPFILGFDVEPTASKKNELNKELEEILSNIDGTSKANLYSAVTAIDWLRQFAQLPFIHFIAQFTNVSSPNYTCPYRNARVDYEEFAAVFSNVKPVPTECLEALMLFSQKKKITENAQDKDIERTVKEFISKANQHFSSIQMFISTVPIIKLGRIINRSFSWNPENIEGVESWFPSFRNQWHKILDVRWNEWVRERKKKHLEAQLFRDFSLSEFPMLMYRPWGELWTQIPFSCELTAGFIGWFTTEKYEQIFPTLSEVMLEGFFVKNENRIEYSEALNMFSEANNAMKALLERLSPSGDDGQRFADFSENRIRTFQIQNQIDSMISDAEDEVREITKKFQKSARMMERVFSGFFDLRKDGIHDTLQNFTTIKGHQNREWRDNLSEIRDLLRKCVYYITELIPIDEASE